MRTPNIVRFSHHNPSQIAKYWVLVNNMILTCAFYLRKEVLSNRFYTIHRYRYEMDVTSFEKYFLQTRG